MTAGLVSALALLVTVDGLQPPRGRPALHSVAPPIPAACRAAVDARLPGWRLKAPPTELAIHLEARGDRTPTNVAFADVDLDGAVDTALLVTTPGRGRRQPHLAVCLGDPVRLHVIAGPYGQDGISVRPKGTIDYDYLTNRQVTYWTNAIQTYAFEKAGGSYLYKEGAFVLIVDGD